MKRFKKIIGYSILVLLISAVGATLGIAFYKDALLMTLFFISLLVVVGLIAAAISFINDEA
jgi:hypothetical protein